VSIAQRIATLHGLVLSHGACADGRGVRATLGPVRPNLESREAAPLMTL
jgi:hypothetical protein